MDYNSNRKHLVLPEYGRNIQKMVDYAITIEDKEERNKAAQAIIDLMGNMYTHLRDVPDFRHKLWDHLAIMSDFKLDIDSPYPLPTLEKLNEKPEPIAYNLERFRFRQYGRIIEKLIEQAIDIEDEKEQQALIMLIANHMKKSLLRWNNDNSVDQQVLKDIVKISKGKITIPEGFVIYENRNTEYRKRKNNTNKHKNQNYKRYNKTKA